MVWVRAAMSGTGDRATMTMTVRDVRRVRDDDGEWV